MKVQGRACKLRLLIKQGKMFCVYLQYVVCEIQSCFELIFLAEYNE